MSFASAYLTHNTIFKPQIREPPSGLLSFIVVVPAYLEENVIKTLESLRDTAMPDGHIEIITVHNFPENDVDLNKNICRAQLHDVAEWSARNSTAFRRVFPLLAADLPARHAGAGLARKIGMDEAVFRFGLIEKPEGMILSLDADTLVSKNYFTEIQKVLSMTSEHGGCLIPFAHPLEGNEFSPDVYKAVIQYELHLRYYKHFLSYTGFPYARYTIGSCFGVRAGVYVRHLGMNRRKAGEDFYFLNKLFPHYKFPDIRGTMVYPSPRPSSRVVFGTGPAISRLVTEQSKEYLTYNPEAFFALKKFFELVPALFPFSSDKTETIVIQLGLGLQQFLTEQRFINIIKEIAENTTSPPAFIKRFYLWFDGFMVVKYLNFSHRLHYKKIPVAGALKEFFSLIGKNCNDYNALQLLHEIRKMDGIEC